MNSISRIAVAVDFSDNSNRALDTAIDYAKRFGASIDLVHAFDVPLPAVYSYEITIPASIITDSREAANARLAQDAEKVAGAGIDCRAHMTEMPAATSIAHLVEELGSDLLVMGTRGHTGLKHVFLGSVAERTVRHSPCSILIVK